MNLSKVKKILLNQYFILSLIILLSLGVRLLSINIKNGLWYDELLTYTFASEGFPLGIIKTLWHYDYHMPLYYFYVNIWIKLFGSSDIALRLSSAIWGVLAVPAAYFLGKTYKSKNLGYFLAFVSAFSPIIIFVSQEFRFYSMLPALSMLSLAFFLKLLDEPKKKNYLGLIISNLLILYVYTMGIIFVAAEIFALLINFYLYKKDSFKSSIKYFSIFFIFLIPYFILLGNYLYASNKQLLELFSWANMNKYSPLILVNDWFSPMITGVYAQDATAYIGAYKSLYAFVTHILYCFVSYTWPGIRNFIVVIYKISSMIFINNWFYPFLKGLYFQKTFYGMYTFYHLKAPTLVLNASHNFLLFTWPSINHVPAFVIVHKNWMEKLLSMLYVPDIGYLPGAFHVLRTFIVLLLRSFITVLFLIGFILSLLNKNKKLAYLSFVLFSFLLLEIILCLKGSFLLTTRYTLIVWPILMLISCAGILSISNKNLKNLFIFCIIAVYVGNVINYKHSYSYSRLRVGGILPIVNCLIKNHIKKGDYILYPDGLSNSFGKYISGLNFIECQIEAITYNDKTKSELYKVFDKGLIVTTTKKNSAEKLIPYFTNNAPNTQIRNFMSSSIDEIPKGHKLFLISDLNLNEKYNQQGINSVVNDYKTGKKSLREYKLEEFYLIRSKIFLDMKNIIQSEPSIKPVGLYTVSYDNKHVWRIFAYEKQ